MNQQQSKNYRDYLTEKYDKNQKVPLEQQILRIENRYIMRQHTLEKLNIGKIIGRQEQAQQVLHFLQQQNKEGLYLILGLPGVGKTIFIKSIQQQVKNHTFFHIQTADFVKDPIQIIDLIFDMAGFYSPSVIVFDEIDVASVHIKPVFQQIKNKLKQINKKIKVFAIVYQSSNIKLQQWPQIINCVVIPVLKDKQLIEFLKYQIEITKFENPEEIIKQVINQGLLKDKLLTNSDIIMIVRDAAMIKVKKVIQQFGGMQNIQNIPQQAIEQKCGPQFQDLAQSIKRNYGSVTIQEEQKVYQICESIKLWNTQNQQ